MEKMLIEVFLPLSNAGGNDFPKHWFNDLSNRLNDRFGGVTIYQRAPATGFWKEAPERTTKDELVIYEVMAEDLELAYWKLLKKELEQQFGQQSILIRCSPVQVL